MKKISFLCNNTDENKTGKSTLKKVCFAHFVNLATNKFWNENGLLGIGSHLDPFVLVISPQTGFPGLGGPRDCTPPRGASVAAAKAPATLATISSMRLPL